MALAARTHRLFIGRRKPQKMIVMSSESGKVEANKAFASCRDGLLTVAGEKDGKFEVEDWIEV